VLTTEAGTGRVAASQARAEIGTSVSRATESTAAAASDRAASLIARASTGVDDAARAATESLQAARGPSLAMESGAANGARLPTNAARAVDAGLESSVVSRAKVAELQKSGGVSEVGGAGGVAHFPQNQVFKQRVSWQAPSSGTGQRYNVYRQEIDWSLEVGSETNLQLAKRGNAPYVMKDGRLERLNLHHSQQDARGALFELSERTHLRTPTGRGREALHPYGRSQHPDFPVDRKLFDVDRGQYWMDRAAEVTK
jgi:hypothetical protein